MGKFFQKNVENALAVNSNFITLRHINQINKKWKLTHQPTMLTRTQ